jgi:hypothetical protein
LVDLLRYKLAVTTLYEEAVSYYTVVTSLRRLALVLETYIICVNAFEGALRLVRIGKVDRIATRFWKGQL